MNRDKVIIMRQLIVNCFARLNTVRKEDKLQVEVVRNLSIQQIEISYRKFCEGMNRVNTWKTFDAGHFSLRSGKQEN